MNVSNIIAPKKKINPTIYAYMTPTNTEKVGWIKIGYTERDAETRIKEQTRTVGIEAKKLWSYEARFVGGGYFNDRSFHKFLEKNKIVREKGTEWFYFNGEPEKAKKLYQDFVFKDYSSVQKEQQLDYQLRTEQEEAVKRTLAYYNKYDSGEFLWNAKPRFGKTLSTYDLVRKMDANHVLIVTNRPAIAHSWYEDFEKFIAWQTDYKFVGEADSLKDKSPMTRAEFLNHYKNTDNPRQVAFLSLQDLKGSKYFGGAHDKLQWIAQVPWDILVIDEAHEGVDTLKTDKAFEQIKRNFTLHLSGTPFKAIAKGSFDEEQIYNWSYQDEQEAKEKWGNENNNPYESLPRLNMLTYQMSNMIVDEVNQGVQLEEEENSDYAFDLNEFFSTKEDGKFVYETDVLRWLDKLTRNQKYPFSTPELRNELKHTFWILNRVASAKALKTLLKNHPVFENYKIVLAAGNGKSEADDISTNENSLKRVKQAIRDNDKTITLSVGQLSTGVTIPEWTGVMMLSNIKSPALYMQAAFRAQNPHSWNEAIDESDVRFKKENAYVFDFAPERTLLIFDEFANNLFMHTSAGGGTTGDRETNIKRLLNFFPVIGEDAEGEMVELDASQVLTIPKTIKAVEVVKRGFMSNFLFSNISGIFQAPQAALDILDKLNSEAQGKVRKKEEPIDTKGLEVNDDGEVSVDYDLVINKSKAIFGDKIFNTDVVDDIILEEGPSSDNNYETVTKVLTEAALTQFRPELEKVKDEYKLTINQNNKIEKRVQEKIVETVTKANTDFKIQQSHLEKELTVQLKSTQSMEKRSEVKHEYDKRIEQAFETYKQEVKQKVTESAERLKQEIVLEEEQRIKMKEKIEVEESVRGRLRGFTRTIPSFIMAYGDRELTLSNFDSYTPEKVFFEVTGITIDQFKFLRDGGDYKENGETHIFEGKLFDETVFNESVQEFLRKKIELSNYFEDKDEDIFDYIPPQKTNQIYTPKGVVKMMVDELEKENPGIYNDSSKTFADLYMKSGLYITEIVKRLYNSPVIKAEYPNNEQRIKHILENQVYGFAPTEIIYNIAVNFIFGNLNSIISRNNFILEDTAQYAREENLQNLINKHFG